MQRMRVCMRVLHSDETNSVLVQTEPSLTDTRSAGSAVGDTYLDYAFSKSKDAGYNMLRFFAMVHTIISAPA